MYECSNQLKQLAGQKVMETVIAPVPLQCSTLFSNCTLYGYERTNKCKQVGYSCLFQKELVSSLLGVLFGFCIHICTPQNSAHDAVIE